MDLTPFTTSRAGLTPAFSEDNVLAKAISVIVWKVAGEYRGAVYYFVTKEDGEDKILKPTKALINTSQEVFEEKGIFILGDHMTEIQAKTFLSYLPEKP